MKLTEQIWRPAANLSLNIAKVFLAIGFIGLIFQSNFNVLIYFFVVGGINLVIGLGILLQIKKQKLNEVIVPASSQL